MLFGEAAVNETRVTTEGLQGARPGREALPGGTKSLGTDRGGGRRKRRRDDESMVGSAEFRSYYGLPVINKPVWEAREIAGYFFLGGLAGASSLVGLGAELTGRPTLARGAKAGAAGAIGLSLVALVKDLGRPARFANMLRVFKPSSPMSVGTWIVSAYAPNAMLAALGEAAVPLAGLAAGGPLAAVVTARRVALLGKVATGVAATLGPAVAAYTGVLIADTAVPAWHGARRELPFLFVSSAAAAASGLGLIVAPPGEAAPMRCLAVAGAGGELAFGTLLERRLEPVVAKAYKENRAGKLMKLAKGLSIAGATGAVLGGRSRALRIASGACLLGASACTRFGVFFAGIASAEDPAATIVPQRERLEERRRAAAKETDGSSPLAGDTLLGSA
ncbi:MAG: Polysulfide reductase NrfD [Acidimicrobiaceae bacterium]|nr:Polysulfide reductase NrfD [Acidimicrobiaceae bacterium]